MITPLSASRFAAVLAALAAWPAALHADLIPVPNASFETPTDPFVSVKIDSWQKNPKPSWYVEEPPAFFWAQLVGAFANTDPMAPDHLDNCDGAQALWIFAVPETGLFQDYDSVDSDDPAPSHDFKGVYQPGKSYYLITGFNGGGGNMQTGVTLDMSLYYRDAGGQKINVATTTVTHSPIAFPNHTHFTDYRVAVPTVQATDPWAWKSIGIRFLSTVSLAMQGGYWDIDNVRLISMPPDVVCTPAGDDIKISWASYVGFQYQVQVSEDLTGDWTDLDDPLPGTNAPLFKLYPKTGHDRAFFRVSATPLPMP